MRPTRTQQLKKPLKLYEPEIPEELLDKKGLADKILKRKEKERNELLEKKKRRKRARYYI